MLSLVLIWGCAESNDPDVAFKEGDYERSFELFMTRAEEGDVRAQNYVGIHYYLGIGVERDYKKANQWYEKAARQGYPDAQRNYANLYHYGLGVPRNYYTAFIWYFASSQQGNVNAKRLLDNLSGENKLSPNQQMHAKIEANEFILDPKLHFKSHDTYVDKDKKLVQ